MATEKTPCKWGCGKLLSKGGCWTHEHKACPNRPPGAELPKQRRKRAQGDSTRAAKAKPRASARKAARDRRDDGAAVPPRLAPSRGDGCFFCAGSNSALAKDLVTRMIRGGMGFDAAAELVRDVVGAMASK